MMPGPLVPITLLLWIVTLTSGVAKIVPPTSRRLAWR